MDWTITKKCDKNSDGYWYIEKEIEHIKGVDITVKIFRNFRTKGSAEKAMTRVLGKINFKDMELI